MTRYIHIICSDPEALFPYSLQIALESISFFEKVFLSSFNNPDEAFLKSEHLEEKILWILFYDNADNQGLNFAKLMNARQNDVNLLILLDKVNPLIFNSFIPLGKVSIVSSNTSINRLLAYIEEIPQKDFMMIDRALQESLLQDFLRPAPTKGLFSKKEKEIIDAVEKGYNIAKTAEVLNLSKNTIATYRSRILKKSKTRSMLELLGKLKNESR